MTTFLLLANIAACFCIGVDARRRGRDFLRWTMATFLFSILITWPLLMLLPRYDVQEAQ